MIIVHGEDTKKSYSFLSELTYGYKEKGFSVLSYDASELDITSLEQKLIPLDLFGRQNLLVISQIFSGVKSKQKESLKKTLQFYQDKPIILYEQKEITSASLKAFSSSQIESFKIPPAIFKFLESLTPGSESSVSLYSDLLSQGLEPEFVFAMIVRQIRLLLKAKVAPQDIKIHPFAKKKLLYQVQKFGLSQLVALHHSLYGIDKQIKLGVSPLPVSQLLVGFLSSL